MLEGLESANRQLSAAAEEQAHFVAVTAHELRTPVGVIGASTSLLGQHWEQMSHEDRTSLLTSMASSAERLRRLVDDLLTVSRLGQGQMGFHGEPVEVASVVQAAVEALRRVRENVKVDVTIPPDLTVRADRDRLAQALDNLLENAVCHGAQPTCVETALRSGMVDIRVRDSGTGVPGDIRDRLFQRFVTGKPRSGTGLGLFIVRELARAQGGDAIYDPSDGDAGSAGAFVLSLPAGQRR